MKQVLSVDFYKITKEKWFFIAIFGMLLVSFGFMWMQKTAMSYTVMLDRVIFLPMSILGLVLSVMISFLVGEDFDGGFIRNKIIAGINRKNIYFSGLFSTIIASLIVYLITCLFTFLIGSLLFESNVSIQYILFSFILGLFMVCSYSSIYYFVAMTTGNKIQALVISIIIACFLLFIGMWDNQIMMQTYFKNGVLNPNYVGGITRVIHSLSFDINPAGQAAQLSAMKFFNPIRFILVDVIICILLAFLGKIIFNKKDLL